MWNKKGYTDEVAGSPGYTDEVAEECHDLIDRAEEEAHVCSCFISCQGSKLIDCYQLAPRRGQRDVRAII